MLSLIACSPRSQTPLLSYPDLLPTISRLSLRPPARSGVGLSRLSTIRSITCSRTAPLCQHLCLPHTVSVPCLRFSSCDSQGERLLPPSRQELPNHSQQIYLQWHNKGPLRLPGSLCFSRGQGRGDDERPLPAPLSRCLHHCPILPLRGHLPMCLRAHRLFNSKKLELAHNGSPHRRLAHLPSRGFVPLLDGPPLCCQE
jgi:hypothetical protein